MNIQDKFNKANVIYKITKDIDLGGETLTIPEGCTLDFQGGSLVNGNVIGNNTRLNVNNGKVGVIFKGSWILNNVLNKNSFINDESAKSIGQNYISCYNNNAGWYETGVAGSFMIGGNNKIFTRPAICGFSNTTITSYGGRDSVPLYAENQAFAPIVFEGDTMFTTNSVTVPKSYDLTQIKEGNYIDVYDSNDIRYTSIVDVVDFQNNIIYVKFDGFRNINNNLVEIPENGSTVYINRITKIWSLNTNAIVESNGNNVSGATGYEVGLNIKKKGVHSVGVHVVALGTERISIGYLVSKCLVAFRANGDNTDKGFQMLGTVDETIPYEENRNYRILESWLTREDGTYHHIAYADKDLNLNNDWAPISITSRTTYLKVSKDGIFINNNFLPDSSGSFNLGSIDNMFKNIYGRNVITTNNKVIASDKYIGLTNYYESTISICNIGEINNAAKIYRIILMANNLRTMSILLYVFIKDNKIDYTTEVETHNATIANGLAIYSDDSTIYLQRSGVYKTIQPLTSKAHDDLSISLGRSPLDTDKITKFYNTVDTSNYINGLITSGENLENGFNVIATDAEKPYWYINGKFVDGNGINIKALNSGNFNNKPNIENHNIPIGFAYFCTDRQTTEGATNGIMIYHKGNDVWVDALGRVVE